MIIGDSSALVALSIMNKLDLLETVFGTIHVPQAVHKKTNANFLLINDRREKSFAKLNDVNVIGSLGVMVLAKELGKVKTIKEDLEKLIDSDIFISENLINRVLASVGE